MCAVGKEKLYDNLYDRWSLGKCRWWGYRNKKMMNKILCVHFFIFLFVLKGMGHVANDVRDVIIFILLAVLFIEVAVIGARYKDGYQIKKEELIYHKGFLREKVCYIDIENIVISHAFSAHSSVYLGRWVIKKGKLCFVPYPWLSLCKQGLALEQLLKQRHNETLTGKLIDNALKKDGLIYSFCWNAQSAEEVLKNFRGNYYITAAIAARYRKEISELIKKYDISVEKIHIIEDVEKRNILWEKY